MQQQTPMSKARGCFQQECALNTQAMCPDATNFVMSLRAAR